MALSLSGIVNGQSPVNDTHLSQFFNLLTGVMVDQPVTFKNTLTVGGGSEAASANKLTLVGVSSQTGMMLRVLLAVGDTNPSFQADKNGKLSWGAGGGSAVDTTLERISATILGINGGLRVAQIATPGAPGAGFSTIYFKADGLPYYRSGGAGAETAIPGTNTTDPLVGQVFGN